MKRKSKSLSGGQIGSPLGPFKEKKICEKINCKLIANRQDKKNKRGVQRGSHFGLLNGDYQA